jgi:transposase InsO family protein
MHAPCVYIWPRTHVYTAYQCHWHVQLGRRNIVNCHCHALRLSARSPTVQKYLQRAITASCCHAKTDPWLRGVKRYLTTKKNHSQTKILSWAIRGRNTKTTVTRPLTLTLQGRWASSKTGWCQGWISYCGIFAFIIVHCMCVIEMKARLT